MDCCVHIYEADILVHMLALHTYGTRHRDNAIAALELTPFNYVAVYTRACKAMDRLVL